MTNPFTHSLDDNFRGQRVRATSNQGTTYVGYVERIHHHDRHVVLRGAERVVDEETDETVPVGAVMVAHCDSIELVGDLERVERIALRTIQPSPYHVRGFDRGSNRQYIEDTRKRAFAGSFPIVRPIDGDLDHPGPQGFEVVEGHKRLWVAAQAGLGTHPVEIVELDDWYAAQWFVFDHLPEYGPEAAKESIRRLQEDWGERIFELPPVREHVDQLGGGFLEEVAQDV